MLICYSAPKRIMPPHRCFGTWHVPSSVAYSHIPALNSPSHSRYSFIDPKRMEGWVNLGPGCKEQLAHGCCATARGQQNPQLCGCWSSMLTTRLSRHPYVGVCLLLGAWEEEEKSERPGAYVVEQCIRRRWDVNWRFNSRGSVSRGS